MARDRATRCGVADRRQLALEQPARFVFGQSERRDAFDRRPRNRLRFRECITRRLRAFANERARAVPHVDHACCFELAVGPRHRVRVDDELLGDGSNRRKLFSRPQRSCFDRVLNLLHEL